MNPKQAQLIKEIARLYPATYAKHHDKIVKLVLKGKVKSLRDFDRLREQLD